MGIDETLVRFAGSLDLCLWKADERGKLTYIGPNSEAFIGMPPEKVINKLHIYEIGPFHSSEPAEVIPELIRNRQEIRNLTIFLHFKNGREVFLEINGHPEQKGSSRTTAYIGTLKDVTKEKQTENELAELRVRSEESENLKTAFLRNFSHEIRTPLNAIVGFADFLEEFDLSGEKKKTYLNIIKQSSQQLLSIVNDIINITALDAGQITYQEHKTDISSLVKRTYRQFESGAGPQNIAFSYKLNIQEDDTVIYTDEAKLSDTLSILLKNAFKFTSEGNIEFGCYPDGGFLVFYCRDTGIGIPSKFRSKVFQRFSQADNSSTRKYGGNGIGLALAKSYVGLLGGEIWFESVPGKGSEFFFTVPNKTVSGSVIQKVPGNNSKRKIMNKTVLVAEDDAFNFFLIRELLSGRGINILHARNGLEAVELLQSSPEVDLVLMDIKMPGMDGFQATRKVKQMRPELPVIAQTAYALQADQDEVREAGFDGYLSKPLNKELLLSLVFKHLNFQDEIKAV
jgi:PAS domain S-box-containing protein